MISRTYQIALYNAITEAGCFVSQYHKYGKIQITKDATNAFDLDKFHKTFNSNSHLIISYDKKLFLLNDFFVNYYNNASVVEKNNILSDIGPYLCLGGCNILTFLNNVCPTAESYIDAMKKIRYKFIGVNAQDLSNLYKHLDQRGLSKEQMIDFFITLVQDKKNINVKSQENLEKFLLLSFADDLKSFYHILPSLIDKKEGFSFDINNYVNTYKNKIFYDINIRDLETKFCNSKYDAANIVASMVKLINFIKKQYELEKVEYSNNGKMEVKIFTNKDFGEEKFLSLLSSYILYRKENVLAKDNHENIAIWFEKEQLKNSITCDGASHTIIKNKI